MNDGKDTAYYLHRGFNVVAVEANPLHCKNAVERWPQFIQAGRLHVENVAIGAQRGSLPFYVSSLDVFSSFDASAATRDGSTCTAIDITYVRAADLFARHGVPYYMKVDIEGADSFCIEDLDPACLPKYFSFEWGHRAPDDVRALADLGYRRFKLINQRIYEFRSDLEPETPWTRLRDRLRHKTRNVLHGRWRDDWTFHRGSSGPFGEDTHGPWVSADKLLRIRSRWQALEDAREGHYSLFDVHAAL